jgi:hypothetical protein
MSFHSRLQIHPERSQQRHERGPFELKGLPHGSLRRWFVYDSQGVIRIEKAVHDRDVDEGFVDRLAAELDELEDRDRREA